MQGVLLHFLYVVDEAVGEDYIDKNCSFEFGDICSYCCEARRREYQYRQVWRQLLSLHDGGIR